MILLSLLTLYCFSKAMKTGQRRWWLEFAIAMAINIYNHIFTVFLVAILLVFMVGSIQWKRQRNLFQPKSQLQNMVIAGSLALFILLPILLLMLTRQDDTDNLSSVLQYEWVSSFPPISINQPTNII